MARQTVLLLLCICIASVLGSWTIHPDIAISNTEKAQNISHSYTNESSIFTVVNCFGSFNIYYDLGTYPNNSNPNVINFDPLDRYNSFGFQVFPGIIYVLAQCTATSTTNNGYCANFTLVQHATLAEVSQFLVATPNAEGSVKGSLSDGGKSGKITWQATSGADNYTLYWAPTQTAPEGKNFATACSVRSWMNLFTSDHGSINDNGDGTWTATVKNLDPKTPFNVVIVANKEGSISGVYNSIALNGKSSASALIPSLALLVIFALATIMW